MNLGYICIEQYSDNLGSHSVFERDPWDRKITIIMREN